MSVAQLCPDSLQQQRAHQAPLSMGISQTRIMEWVAISFSRGIFLTQGLNLGLLPYRQVLLPSEVAGKP